MNQTSTKHFIIVFYVVAVNQIATVSPSLPWSTDGYGIRGLIRSLPSYCDPDNSEYYTRSANGYVLIRMFSKEERWTIKQSKIFYYS